MLEMSGRCQTTALKPTYTVTLYSFGTQFVQSALFCIHPKGAVAFCYSPFIILIFFYLITSVPIKGIRASGMRTLPSAFW